MAAVRGVFTLNRVRLKKFVNEWTDLAQVWINQIPDTGYFGGGSPVGSIMDKVTYSSDTTAAVPTAKLNVARYNLAATGNSTAGYFGGGTGISPTIPAVSVIEKITYSTDIAQVISSGLPVPYSTELSATGNASAGYFGGGTPGTTSVALTVMYKLHYATDTALAIPSAYFPFPSGVSKQGATGNSTAGYFGGSGYSYMWKLSYSTENTVYTSTANLSAPRSSPAATGNSTAGYFGGGSYGVVSFSTMDKVTYSADTTEPLPSTGSLSAPRFSLAATGSSTAGYFGAGSMDKVTYSSDTTAAVPGAALSVARIYLAASSAKANALPQNLWRRFSDGSTTTNPASLPPATPTPQTVQVPTPDTGYFGGGGTIPTGTYYSTMDKLTYSSDTTAAIPSANFPTNRADHGATGSSTAGYFGGGSFSSTRMDKTTYSSDTTAAVPGANLSLGRGSLAATGNSTHGYFGGGSFTYSTMDMTTYSSDTTAAVPGANLSLGRGSLAATGNSTAGYFGGGSPGPAGQTTMDKVTYSTDTTAPLPSTGSLSVSRYNFAATGNSTHGYFGGGDPSFVRTIVDKITYSSDTTAPVPSAFLVGTFGRRIHAATGNSNAGYFFAGAPVSDGTDKINYSTDTTTAIFGALPSISNRYKLAASSAKANALPQSTYSAPVLV